MANILTIVLLVMLNLCMIVFLFYNAYECVESHKFYKRMTKQHNEFMKSLERDK